MVNNGKKLSIKIMSLCLALLLLLPFVASGCDSGGKGETTTTTAQNETDPPGGTTTEPVTADIQKPAAVVQTWADDLPIRFAYQDSATGGGLTRRSIIPDDEGNSTNQQIKLRNSLVNEELKVTISISETHSDAAMTGMKTKITDALQNFTPDFEVVVGYLHYSAGLCFFGKGKYFYNLNAIPAERNNLHLDQGYWGTDLINGMTYKGATWWVTGDISLRYIAGFYVTFINQNIWDEHKIQFAAKAKEMFNVDYDPNKNFIYDLVEDGYWNLDFFSYIVSEAYKDNGDGERGTGDTFGFVLEANDIVDGMLIGSGVKFSRYNANGNPYNPWEFAIAGQYENDIYLVDKLEAIRAVASTANKGTFLPSGGGDSSACMGSFASGEAMCVINKLFLIETYLTSVNFPFFVVPTPNWSLKPTKSGQFYKSNTQYNSGLHDGLSIFAIPSSCRKAALSATTATLDLMSYYSYLHVRSAYYDSAINLTLVQDERSAAMIRIAHDAIFYDPLMIWNGPTSADSFGEVVNHYRGPLTSSSGNLNTATTLQAQWTTALKTWLKDKVEVAYNNSKDSSMYPDA